MPTLNISAEVQHAVPCHATKHAKRVEYEHSEQHTQRSLKGGSRVDRKKQNHSLSTVKTCDPAACSRLAVEHRYHMRAKQGQT
eukprot:6210568-Pleurochrysis_carterae.AAC.3